MKNKFRKGISFVVYSLEGKKPKYLVLKRKLHWVGWEFPKGGVEKFESKRKALIRELFEETGFNPTKIKNHHFSGKYLYPRVFKDRPGMIGQTFSLYSVETKKEKAKIDKREHTSSKWLDYKDAYKILTHKDQKKSLKIVNDWLNHKSKLK